jgi:hypothetical protein
VAGIPIIVHFRMRVELRLYRYAFCVSAIFILLGMLTIKVGLGIYDPLVMGPVRLEICLISTGLGDHLIR